MQILRILRIENFGGGFPLKGRKQQLSLWIVVQQKVDEAVAQAADAVKKDDPPSRSWGRRCCTFGHRLQGGHDHLTGVKDTLWAYGAASGLE